MKTTKVYHAPGYPIDPAKEESRMLEGLNDFRCVMIPKEPIVLKSQTVTLSFDTWEEAMAYVALRTLPGRE